MTGFDIFLKNIGDVEMSKDEPLKNHTTFKIGGNAKAIVFPKTVDEMKKVILSAKENDVDFYILGKGSNVLCDDRGYDGAIISTLKLDEVLFDGECVTAYAGVNLTALSYNCARRGLAGLEFAYGIPGSVGGAIYMNAGAYGGEMKDVVVETSYMDRDGNVHTLTGEENAFDYRKSAYTNSDRIILSAKMKFTADDPDGIIARENELMSKRQEKQPLDYPSAGSTFKRYPGRYTGQMIEECGLKGVSVGGAEVSEKHAGFVINKDNATSGDVINLINLVRNEVIKKHGVKIECEVKHLSNKGEIEI